MDDKEELGEGHQESLCEQPNGDGGRPNPEKSNESGHSNEQVCPKIQDFELVFVGPRFCVIGGLKKAISIKVPKVARLSLMLFA